MNEKMLQFVDFVKKGVDKGTKICYYIGAKEIKTKTEGLRFLGESII